MPKSYPWNPPTIPALTSNQYMDIIQQCSFLQRIATEYRIYGKICFPTASRKRHGADERNLWILRSSFFSLVPWESTSGRKKRQKERCVFTRSTTLLNGHITVPRDSPIG